VGQAFLTTHWSLIGDIQSGDDGNRALIGLLLERYWKPVYFYLRRKGHSHEEAEDLTQGFFHEVVLNRNLIQRADQAKGRFRTFLLHALKHYLIDEHHKRTALKRMPRDKLVPLDLTDSPALPAVIGQSDPQESYNYGWMASLLDQILSQVETKCAEQDMDLHWKLFYDSVICPILDNMDPPSLGEVCQKYHLSDKKKASNMVITVKRCFRATLWEYVRDTVMTEEETEEELTEIMRLFGKCAQRLSKSSDHTV
jgi:RNA polymerase sigma-70 factor (ECF subfamily)